MTAGVLIYLSICGIGLFATRGKTISIVLVLLICIGMLNAVEYADYQEYSTAYNLVLYHSDEFFRYPAGWINLCRIFAYFDVPYNVFQTVIIGLSLCMFYLVFSHYTQEINLAFSLFAIYPLLIECIQYRSMFAVAICTLGFLMLEKPGYKRRFLYICLVMLAMQFHTSVVVFMLPACVSIFRCRFGQKTINGNMRILMFSICLLAAVFCIARFAPQLMSFFLHDRDATYLNNISSQISTVARIAAVYLFNAYISSKIAAIVQLNADSDAKRELATVMQITNYLLIAGVALLVFNTNFYRFLRFYYPINIALLSLAFGSLQDKKSKAALIILGVLYVLLGTTLDLFWTFEITGAPILNGIVSWLN